MLVIATCSKCGITAQTDHLEAGRLAEVLHYCPSVGKWFCRRDACEKAHLSQRLATFHRRDPQAWEPCTG